jgi:hypothetical protein
MGGLPTSALRPGLVVNIILECWFFGFSDSAAYLCVRTERGNELEHVSQRANSPLLLNVRSIAYYLVYREISFGSLDKMEVTR